MLMTSRPYGGQLFRPLPEIHLSEDQTVLIVATPWGNPAIAKDFISGVLKYWRDAQQDSEKTSTYVPDDGLSYGEHLFKMSILATHEDLKDKYNEGELSAGLEVLCLYKNQQQISWFQVGAPSLILIRDHSMMPLYHAMDFSYDYSTAESELSPLPKDLLGVQQQVNLRVGSLKYKKNDRFLMISRSSIPSQFFQNISPETLDLDTATQLLASDNQSQPFWLGLVLMD